MTDDVYLAQAAANGDPEKRQTVIGLVDPLALHQTRVFCKRFCKDNRYKYICTLDNSWSKEKPGAVTCAWGNASYEWILSDLTAPERLKKFDGRGGAPLTGYLSSIVNSLPFFERWKNWRFGRRVRIPTYIQEIGDKAGKIFLWLHSGDTIPNMAQRLGATELEVQELAKRVIVELTKRKKLYLLNPPKTVSLTGFGQHSDEDYEDAQGDIPDDAFDHEVAQTREMLWKGWGRLNAVEQFVLEQTDIEGQEADAVLKALCRLGISIIEGIPPEKTSRQQLYYFRRKTLVKLAKYSGLNKREKK